MKKLILSVIIAATLGACGGGNDPVKDANDLCDCFIKANGMKADDPGRAAEQDKCTKMSTDQAAKYKDDPDEYKAYNDAISECNNRVMDAALKGTE